MTCYPWWHAKFAPLRGTGADKILRSGCSVGADGNIACAPERMRATTERALQASGYWPATKPLDLGTYTLARNIESEQGGGTVEERVAVGESTRNHGWIQLKSRAASPQDAVLRAALYTQPSRLYGEIQSGTTGRFTSTSRDPSILSLLLADFVISGQSGDFAKGADDQNGIEYQKYFPSTVATINRIAEGRRYWVGPLPGVDHWRLTLFVQKPFTASSPEGQALIKRAVDVFGNATYANGKVTSDRRPNWPADLPVCGRVGSGGFILAMLVGLGAGAYAFSRFGHRFTSGIHRL